MYKKGKYGFSLAETLLTMVILGIILAFILPSITSTKPSESKLLYKKTFFTISEAVMAVINNPELYDMSEFDVLLYPVIIDNSSSENFCQYLANYLNTVGEIKCDSYPGSLKLANGVAISGIPKEYKKDCKLSTGVYENVCTMLVHTDGDISNQKHNESSESCAKGSTVFRINIAENGKVFTGNEWRCENSILETGTRVQQDKDK